MFLICFCSKPSHTLQYIVSSAIKQSRLGFLFLFYKFRVDQNDKYLILFRPFIDSFGFFCSFEKKIETKRAGNQNEGKKNEKNNIKQELPTVLPIVLNPEFEAWLLGAK